MDPRTPAALSLAHVGALVLSVAPLQRPPLPPPAWELVGALVEGNAARALVALDAWRALRSRRGHYHTAVWSLAVAGMADAGVEGDELVASAQRGQAWEWWEIAAALVGIPGDERRRARRELARAFRRSGGR